MKRILIVDDKEENLYLLRVLLEGHGYEVEQATNGSEALVKALASKQDMIISDILMPVMDGFTLCRALKTDDRLKHIPLIFYTATYTDAKDEKLALDMGANAFIIKPMEPDEFMRRVEEILAANKDGKLSASQKQTAGDEVVLKEYNKVLIQKLEHKMLSLEQANKALEAEIAARKQVEKALRESEEKLLILLDESPDPIFSLTAAGLYGYVNRAFAEGVGKPVDEIVGRMMWDVFPKDEADKRFAALSQVFHTGTEKVIEVRVPRSDGDRFYLTTITPIRDAQGNVAKAICSSKNITERKLMEEALQESEERFSTIFRTCPVAIALTRIRDNILWDINEAWEKTTGYSKEDAVGHSTLELDLWVVPAERQKMIESLQKDGMARSEENIRRKTGEIIDVMMQAVTITLSGENYLLTMADDITERKRAEDQLKASEARLHALVDSTPFPLAVVDVEDNEIEYWSRSAFELFGHTAPTATAWYQLAYPDPEYRRDVMERWKPFLEKARRSGKSVNTGEYRVSCHDGSVRICELYATFLSDRLIVTFNDITGRKQAEELLGLKNHVFDTSIAANSIADIDGVITEANDSFLKVWGYSSKDEVVGHSISYFFNEPEEAVAIVNALNENGSWQGNFTAKKKDGTTFIAHCMATALRDENGKLTGYQSSVMDITEHRRTEETLREKETQYRALADTGLALIWTAGTDKLCNYFNQPWLKFTGRTLEQEMGNGWTEGVHPEDIDRCVQIYVTAFDKREAFDMNYRLRHASGEYRWIRDLGTPNYNSSGKFIGYIGHCFDITEQKTAEDVIKKLNENLEQRVKERTADLHKTIDLLEETNRAFVGRELIMIELKERIAELEKQEK